VRSGNQGNPQWLFKVREKRANQIRGPHSDSVVACVFRWGSTNFYSIQSGLESSILDFFSTRRHRCCAPTTAPSSCTHDVLELTVSTQLPPRPSLPRPPPPIVPSPARSLLSPTASPARFPLPLLSAPPLPRPSLPRAAGSRRGRRCTARSGRASRAGTGRKAWHAWSRRAHITWCAFRSQG
jgi:hypothetical protein